MASSISEKLSFEQLELSDYAKANLKRALKPHEAKYIADYVHGAAQRDDIIFKINTLRDLHMFQTILSADKAMELLLSMKERLSGLFYFDDDTAYITPEGLNIAKDELVKIYPNWAKTERKHIIMSDLKDEIAKIAQSEEEHLRVNLLVSRNSEDAFDPHLFPLFVEKRGQKLFLAITDSRGSDQDSTPLDYIEKELGNQNLTIYHHPIARQHDHFSCPVFSELDVFNVAELELSAAFNFFDFLAENATFDKTTNEGKHTLYKISSLPPTLMKVTQSFTQLTTHLGQSPSPELPSVRRTSFSKIFISRPSDNRALEASVNKTTFYNREGRPENHYIQRKWLRFVHLIALRTLKDC